MITKPGSRKGIKMKYKTKMTNAPENNYYIITTLHMRSHTEQK